MTTLDFLLQPEDYNKLSKYLFSHIWKVIPTDKKELWRRMCLDKLYETLEISGFNTICQSIYENNIERGHKSELLCVSAVEALSELKKISVFFVTYGAKYGNLWFSSREQKTMESIGGEWEAPFLLIYKDKDLIKIHHLPEEIYDLTEHELDNGRIYITMKFMFYENIWIIDENGEKIGETETFFPIKNKFKLLSNSESIRPNVLYEDSLESLNVNWNIYKKNDSKYNYINKQISVKCLY